jgi:hypothetical protein
MMDKKKKREVEWSFSFEEIGDKFRDMFGSWAEEAETSEGRFDAELGGATRAIYEFKGAVGRLNFEALPDESDKLIEAELVYVGDAEFSVDGDETKKVVLKVSGTKATIARPFKKAFGEDRDNLKWDLRLSPRVMAELKLKGCVGKGDLNLSRLQVSRVDMDGSVGELTLTLPVMREQIVVDWDGSVGQNRIIVPDGASADIRIDGSVGETIVSVSPNTALRVKVKGNLGGVSVPDGLEKVQRGGDFLGMSGVWESPGFETASPQVEIALKGGVGRLKVYTHEIA